MTLRDRVFGVAGVAVIAFSIYNLFHPVGPIGADYSEEVSEEVMDVEEGPKSDSPDEFDKYFMEITTMVGQESSGYTSGYSIREFQKAKQRQSTLRTKETEWTERGPGNVSGRTRGLIIHPEDPAGRTWIAGSAGGGIWKTENSGQDWVNLTPDLPNLSTTTLALSLADPSIIYAGTGEGFFNAGSITGDGIFKSIDGGQSWTQLITGNDIKGLQNVNRIIVDPNDPDIVLACGNGFPPFESGVYKSVDGGLTWTNVFKASARVQQIIADPKDFNVQYATINSQGIIKSVDGGDTWSGTGIGLNASGRIELAVSPTNTQILYASAESSVSGGESAVFVSNDGGANWNVVAPQVQRVEWLGEQGWYDNAIRVHPFDPEIVYVGGVHMFKAELTEQTRNRAPQVTGVAEEGTEEFMNWINAGLSQLRGGLGTSEEWFEDHEGYPIDVSDEDFTSVEIRFGPGKKQMAHRFTVPPNAGTANDGGAGVIPTDHNYQDYVEVPFEVWDIDNNQQLMVSFRDNERDGKWNLITRSEVDPVPGREYIFVNAVPYNPDSPDPNMTTDGGHGYKTLYCMWPTLAEGYTFDDTALPESKLVINYGEIIERIANVEQITNGNTSNSIHVDVHNIQTFSTQPGVFNMIVATDGGVYFSIEEENPGESDNDWSRAGFGYNTSQFYGVDKKPGSSNYVGGTQDNGTWISLIPDPTAISSYVSKIGGDGFEAVWSYFEPDLVIGGAQNNRFRRSIDGGINWMEATNGLNDTGQDGAPFFSKLEAHKLLPRVLLTVGESGVWRSNDFGASWFLNPIDDEWISSEITSSHNVKFSLSNPSIIWAGGGMTSERSMHVSTNGGQDFQKVPNIADTIGSISGFATHPFEDFTAYALFSFKEYGKVFRTTDLGQTWEDISGFNGNEESNNGFPDVEVSTLLVLPHEPETIWVGTEIGIFESTDNGESWHILNGNIPAASIYKLIAVDDQVVAATHGRGIWSTTLPGLKWPLDVIAGVEDELENVDLNVFPNPADENIQIQYEGLYPGPVIVNIIDPTGRLVITRNYTIQGEKGILDMDLTNLQDGLYILNLKLTQGSKSVRIAVKH